MGEIEIREQVQQKVLRTFALVVLNCWQKIPVEAGYAVVIVVVLVGFVFVVRCQLGHPEAQSMILVWRHR